MGATFKRGAKVGMLTLVDYVTNERWLCQCECGAREFRTFGAIRDSRTLHCCRACHAKQRAARKPEKAVSAARAHAEAVRSALAAVATPKNLQRVLRGRRLDTSGLLAELDIHCEKGSLAAAEDWLRLHGCRKSVTLGRNTWEWVGLEKRGPASAPIGPCFEVGAGEKRECARYESCLVAFLKSYPGASAGRCPSGCAYFLPLERARLLRKACEDVSYAQRGANLGGAA